MNRKSKQAGLDTSVVLRLLTREPRKQAETALQLIQDLARKQRAALLTDTVIAETYFALHTHYGVPKAEALSKILDLLDSGYVTPEEGSGALEVLTLMRSKQVKPGFVDRLIHARYAKLSAEFFTFERAAKKLPNTTLLT